MSPKKLLLCFFVCFPKKDKHKNFAIGTNKKYIMRLKLNEPKRRKKLKKVLQYEHRNLMNS